MANGLVFRRIGNRVVPIIKSALQQAGANTPAVRSGLAKSIQAARKGRGRFGAFAITHADNGNVITFHVPKRGLPVAVAINKPKK